ncbi:MAG: DNA-processing protein DprA [Bacteroidales bacterium]
MLLYQIALSLVKEIGPVNGKKLVAYMGSSKAIFEGDHKKLVDIPGISKKLIAELSSKVPLQKAEQEIKYIEKHNIKPLFYTDKDYPQRLRHCADAPIMLYFRGNADLNHRRTLALVGTRNATEYGKNTTEKIIEDLKGTDAMIISGLAFGIDSYAHKFALKHNMPTLGVVAHGHDKMYPAQNRNLASKMLEQGGVISEFAHGTIPEKNMFPRRNRIIAGMSDATVVVESALKGGALITAELANSYNRDVFAVPGKSYDNYSKGCNALIKRNAAALIESGEDVRKMMNWDIQDEQLRNQQRKLFLELTQEEKMITDKLKINGPSTIDWLAVETNMPSSKLSSILLKLEFNGLLKSLPGNQYQLL